MNDKIDKANIEELKKLVQIDDNIKFIKDDLREYARGARDQIRDLEKQKAKIRESLGQISMF